MASDGFGYVKISRKAYESDPLWTERRVFSRWEAWEDLIQLAAWKPYRKMVGMTAIDLQRGEFMASVRYLAKRWCWGKHRVDDFLKALLTMGRISGQKRTHEGDTYLLVNYEVYQSNGTRSGTDGGTVRGQSGDKEEDSKGSKALKTSIGVALPDDWRPKADHRELASRVGMDVVMEYEKFRDHAAMKGRKMRDWDAAFRNWLRNAREFKNGNRPPSGSEAARVRNELPGKGRTEQAEPVHGDVSPNGKMYWNSDEGRWRPL